MTFHEDHTRRSCGFAGHVMASLNYLVIGRLHHAGVTNLAQARHWCAAHLSPPDAHAHTSDRSLANLKKPYSHGHTRRTIGVWSKIESTSPPYIQGGLLEFKGKRAVKQPVGV